MSKKNGCLRIKYKLALKALAEAFIGKQTVTLESKSKLIAKLTKTRDRLSVNSKKLTHLISVIDRFPTKL
jgi:hypothetical protein